MNQETESNKKLLKNVVKFYTTCHEKDRNKDYESFTSKELNIYIASICLCVISVFLLAGYILKGEISLDYLLRTVTGSAAACFTFFALKELKLLQNKDKKQN